MTHFFYFFNKKKPQRNSKNCYNKYDEEHQTAKSDSYQRTFREQLYLSLQKEHVVCLTAVIAMVVRPPAKGRHMFG